MRVGAGVVLIAVAFVTACGSDVPPDVYYRAQTALGAGSGGPASGAASAAPASNTAPAAPIATGAASSAVVTAASAPRSSGSHAAVASSSAAATRSSSHSTAPAHNARSSSTATTASSSRPAAGGCTPPTAKTPTVVVCPNTGLHEGQTVKVYASGFPGGQYVVVIECADKGDDTGQSDCGPIHSTQIGSSGTLTGYELPVTKKPGRDTCSSTQRCLISVTQASLTPKYEADQHIAFA